jgi:hypothetical protein
LRFTRTVLAVLVANLLTIGLLTGAYYYLKSDSGQAMLYEMGLHSFFMASLVTPQSNSEPATALEGFSQPGISDMRPMSVEPRANNTTSPQHPPSGSSTDQEKNLSAIRSSLKMCRFWNAEYQKDGTQQSKQYRDAACSRYERLSGRDSDKVVGRSGSSSTSVQASYQQQQALRERQSEKKRKAEEKRVHKEFCARLNDRIDRYDSLMRQGGSSQYMNRLRSDRRELSLEYSRKCLLGQ